jgi:hypothetical protein
MDPSNTLRMGGDREEIRKMSRREKEENELL